MANESSPVLPSERLLSLDVFRGLAMFLLIGEGAHVYGALHNPAFEGTWLYTLGTQFHHHPWHGLRFWDLIQPAFMFIVGVAIPFSVANRTRRGDTSGQLLRHAMVRALVLLLLGWAVYCIQPGRITFRFQNVMAQLSFTYLIAFLCMRRSFAVQLGISFVMIGITEILYRTFSVEGFDQPFTNGHSFGSYVNLLISGEQNSWAIFNAVPTTAHTMWGVMAGQLLISNRTSGRKIFLLAGVGLIGVVAGYALDPVTPIIKRICTSSFVIVSGGWCLLALAFSYWLIDVVKVRKCFWFLAVVGMNPLAIYLFGEVQGPQWIRGIPRPFVEASFGWAGNAYANLVLSFIVWAMLWYICYWLYRRKIFIKI